MDITRQICKITSKYQMKQVSILAIYCSSGFNTILFFNKNYYILAPLPQANLPSLVNTSTDSIEIRWKEYLFPVTNYSLCVRKLNEIGCEKSFTTSKTTFLIEGLQAATNYSVTIVAVTKTSKSMMSDRLNFTTGLIILNLILDVSIIEID